jgi:putative resolvase
MKLSKYARQHEITYRAAWERFRKGKIEGAYKADDGHIIVPSKQESLAGKVAIYARVSSNQNKDNLEAQAERLRQYAIAKGYQIIYVVKEVGSGVNDSRRQLLKLFDKDDWGVLLVEHKDRLTRFGFNYIQTLLEKDGKTVEVVNVAEEETTDLIQDLVAVVYSYSAKLYGLRRNKRKTEKLVENLLKEKDE